MPLSPQDVRNKLFTPVRFKYGYDEDEVDAFLDEVEAELTRLGSEIEELTSGRARDDGADHDARNDADDDSRHDAASGDLQAQLDAVRADSDERAAADLREVERRYSEQLAALGAESDAQLAALQSPPRFGDDDQIPVPRSGLDAAELELQVAEARRHGQDEAQQQLAQLTAQLQEAHGRLQLAHQQTTAAVGEVERLRAEQASVAAPTSGVSEETLRRTLLLAQRTADEAVSEAREEAATIVSSARTEAEETARTAAAEHAAVTRQRDADHAAAISRGRAEHDLLVGKLEELRSFERDYRSRLRAYLHLQLRDLEAGAPEPTAAVTARQTAAISSANGLANGSGKADPNGGADAGPNSNANGDGAPAAGADVTDLQPAQPVDIARPDDVDAQGEADESDITGQSDTRSRWFDAPEPAEEAR